VADRRLVSLRRTVPEEAGARYDALWLELAAEVRAGGAHAWRFASSSLPSLRLEFLEFADGADPRDRPEIGGLLRRLEREVAPASAEEWDDR
jgi:hypothetical protein